MAVTVPLGTLYAYAWGRDAWERMRESARARGTVSACATVGALAPTHIRSHARAPARSCARALAPSCGSPRLRRLMCHPRLPFHNRPMELIIAEKNNAAERIAEILSEGRFSTERVNGVNVYRWGDRACVGLAGHVVEVDFTEEYNDWHAVDPSELVDAELRKTPSQNNIYRAVEQLAREADRAVIATDYDSEGELIGKEAYEIIEDATSVPIDRVRFSSLTPGEVRSAFEDRDELDFDLAAAGEARQIIDLIWGAALTRYLSLTSKRLGDSYLSVGRVQSPTLKILVDREREIEAFDPETYWELFADAAKDDDVFESQYFYRDEDGNEAERVWDEDRAQEVYATVEDAATALVDSVNTRTRNDYPPAPFDTTQFIRAAGAIGYSASRAMSVAEDLYTQGFISYPRTDNTVYPDDIDVENVMEMLASHDEFAEDAQELLSEPLEPTEGDKETTDHPPIYPTAHVTRDELGDDEWEIYELVVRRFFATFADRAKWEHVKTVLQVRGETFKANGKRLLDPGYHAYYPYFNTSENRIPELDEDDVVDVEEARIEEKETQPPGRIGQSKLVEEMEDMGIGTKCLTADTRVLVRDEDGEIARRPIGDLFDEGRTVMADGDADVAVTEDGPTTLSLDETSRELVDRAQTLVSRRDLEDGERVYQVATDGGSFSATGDHPVYVRDERGDIAVKPVDELEVGEELVTARSGPATEAACDAVVTTWEEFAAACDKSSKLYGTGVNSAIRERRRETGESQAAFAERFGTYHDAISRFENDDRDVPVWLLGELGVEPEGLHGLNADRTFPNPFPIYWSPALARLLANVLGDGSVHVDEDENVVDVRYHNTDPRLIERFVADVEEVFGVDVKASGSPGRESHHRRRYQVQLPSAVSRVLLFVLETVSEGRVPRIPPELGPAFVGALFDDEGHVSREGKAFISNTDHALLRRVESQLGALGIDADLEERQHKLYVRGRRDLERFVDEIPIAADEKFYRGLERLRRYPVTARKARVLARLSERPLTSTELAEELDVSVSVAQSTLRELRDDGYVEQRIEGSNRAHDGNRTFRYVADGFEDSVYAAVEDRPATATVRTVEEREYDGPVYDLTIDESAPNFAVDGGAIVHNSTRHNTIQKLYDRGYVESSPPRPTGLARAVIGAMEEYADVVTDPEMTEQLEADMKAIADGDVDMDEVMDESREMLDRVFEILEEKEEEIGESLRQGLRDDRTLGPCPECGEDLLIRRARGGSQFVGCDGYPDCENTYPLPDRGKLTLLDEECDDHELFHVKVLDGRSTYTHGCPICKAEEADESDDRVIGDCPDCHEEHGGELAIKKTRSGGRLVGCTRYPDCDYSLPLPRRGDVVVTDEICEEHDLPEVEIHTGGDDPWELGCPICNYIEYKEQQEDDEEDGLKALDGVGPATEEKLEDAGIEEVEDLVDADPEELADEVPRVTAEKIEEWQSAAG